MKIWLTKYSLTSGIQEIENFQTFKNDDRMIGVENEYSITYYHKPYWHETKQDAICHAESMKNKKISSLQKQIKKLQDLDFN